MLLIINTGRRRHGIEKNVAKTFINNDTNLVKNENNLDTNQVTNKFDTIKTQSGLETCKSSTHLAYSYSQVS